MCGIAGVVFWEGLSASLDPEVIVRRMIEPLGHRGPDGRGVARCSSHCQAAADTPAVALGHRRLAIIDLSERAAQPMRSRKEPVWLTYNGEVYNFRSIRRDLEARGREFCSESDTEVVLQGYEEWGQGVLDRLRGMFALAIWDGRTGQLILARDRLGIKPLYIARVNGALLFGSEIRALLGSGLVARRLDLLALDQFLAYQTVPPPRTLVDGVCMVAPGQVVVASRGRFEERLYWDLLEPAAQANAPVAAVEARARLGEILAESAALHLVSDVPVGVFLSGGVDSSALVALVRRTGLTPRTFSVAVPGTRYDEAPIAREVAAAFGTEHTEIALTEAQLLQQLPDALAGVDHPSADGINTFVVSRAVRAAGVKVALSGLGGDEFFGGYPSFARLRRLTAWAQVWRRSPAVMRRAAAAAVRTFGGSSVASVKAAALLESDGTLAQTFPVMRQLFPAAQRVELVGRELVERSGREGDPYVTLLARAADRHPDVGLMSFVSYAEARTYMHDVLLRDTDQMSMRHGLEVRVPLLDHVLVEYVMGLPDAVKHRSNPPKRLLIDSLGIELPPAVHRPKQGFVLPFDLWMRDGLRPFCDHHLGAGGLGGRSLFRPDAVSTIWESFLTGRTSWSRPWALVALNAWMEQTGVSA